MADLLAAILVPLFILIGKSVFDKIVSFLNISYKNLLIFSDFDSFFLLLSKMAIGRKERRRQTDTQDQSTNTYHAGGKTYTNFKYYIYLKICLVNIK